MKTTHMNKNELRNWMMACRPDEIKSLFVRKDNEAFSYVEDGLFERKKIELDRGTFDVLVLKIGLPKESQQIDAWPNVFVPELTKKEILERIAEDLSKMTLEKLKKVLEGLT